MELRYGVFGGFTFGAVGILMAAGIPLSPELIFGLCHWSAWPRVGMDRPQRKYRILPKRFRTRSGAMPGTATTRHSEGQTRSG